MASQAPTAAAFMTGSAAERPPVSNSHDRAIDALHAIPPDVLHGEWVRAAMAFHAAGGDFDTFDLWSASARSYDAQACGDLWKRIKPGQGIGAGTLYRMAEIHGNSHMGEDKPQRQAPQAPKQATQAPRKAAEPPRKASTGTAPTEVLERFQAATTQHPCIVQKLAGKRVGEVERAVLEFLTAHKAGIKKAVLAKHFDGRYERANVYRAVRTLVAAQAVYEAAGMVCPAEVAK
jgi:hypothetical protein